MSSKPKIVLVPGAWITPAFYDRLQSCLSERGLDSVAVQHQSTGAEPPIKTLEDDVSQLRGTLEQLCDAGSDVIVAAHSYGGVVSSGAVLGLDKTTRQSQGKSGGVVMIVYMVAFVLQKGDSLIGATGGQLLPWIKAEVSSATPNGYNSLLMPLFRRGVTHTTRSARKAPTMTSRHRKGHSGLPLLHIPVHQSSPGLYPTNPGMSYQLHILWARRTKCCRWLSRNIWLEYLARPASTALKRRIIRS
jgi:pimeloyl-ACP methyl ester carboxylesterase